MKTVTLIGICLALVTACVLTACNSEPLPLDEPQSAVLTTDLAKPTTTRDLGTVPDLADECPIGICVPYVPVACTGCYCDPQIQCAHGCALYCP